MTNEEENAVLATARATLEQHERRVTNPDPSPDERGRNLTDYEMERWRQYFESHLRGISSAGVRGSSSDRTRTPSNNLIMMPEGQGLLHLLEAACLDWDVHRASRKPLSTLCSFHQRRN